jgi:mRNA interferase MazF
MTHFEPGDVVLVRFPFTDLSSTKQRPAVVVSPPEFSERYGDVVMLALTSQEQPDPTLTLARWSDAGLLKPTWVKPLVGTIAGALVVKKLGNVPADDLPVVRYAVSLVVSNEIR